MLTWTEKQRRKALELPGTQTSQCEILSLSIKKFQWDKWQEWWLHGQDIASLQNPFWKMEANIWTQRSLDFSQKAISGFLIFSTWSWTYPCTVPSFDLFSYEMNSRNPHFVHCLGGWKEVLYTECHARESLNPSELSLLWTLFWVNTFYSHVTLCKGQAQCLIIRITEAQVWKNVKSHSCSKLALFFQCQVRTSEFKAG